MSASARPAHLYRVVPLDVWERDVIATSSRELARAELDVRTGFLHLSTTAQLRETLRRYFAGVAVQVLRFHTEALATLDLRWEQVAERGSDYFPHLYADTLPLDTPFLDATATLLPRSSSADDHVHDDDDDHVVTHDAPPEFLFKSNLLHVHTLKPRTVADSGPGRAQTGRQQRRCC